MFKKGEKNGKAAWGKKHLHLVDFDDDEYEKHLLFEKASGYGYALNLDLPIDILREQIEDMKADREGKPLCYRRSFKPTSPYCRVCDLNLKCGENYTYTEGFIGLQLDLEPCNVCDVGQLNIELLDPKTHKIVNYGCSSLGCPNTLLDKRRFDTYTTVDNVKPIRRDVDMNLENAPEPPKSRTRRITRDGEPTTTGQKIDIPHAADMAFQYIKENGGYLKNLSTLKYFLNTSVPNTKKIVESLEREGKIARVAPDAETGKKPSYKYVVNPHWKPMPDIEPEPDDDIESEAISE